ncbi:MAG: DUF5684 domain-containing protein [Flavobacteriales bacterium]|nr:DUF5684 domain-containing protein [Flavobacteriales bacterium]
MGNLIAAGAFMLIIYVAIIVIMLVSMWKIFTKAGKPGWACIVPIYNIIVLLEIVNKPVWWILLYLIPIANIIVGIIVIVNLAKAFGKDVGYAIGLILLPIVFIPMLAFSDAQYNQPVAA